MSVIHVLVLYPITVAMMVVGETLSLSLNSFPPMEALNHCSENQLLWLEVYGHSLMVMCVLHKNILVFTHCIGHNELMLKPITRTNLLRSSINNYLKDNISGSQHYVVHFVFKMACICLSEFKDDHHDMI